MPKLSLETYDREKPILLLAGDKNPLVQLIIRDYVNEFTIAYITDSPKPKEYSENIYRIRHDAAELLKNLEEKVEYAIVFLEEENIKHIGHIFEKLKLDKTKTAVVVDIRENDHFSEQIYAYKKLDNFYYIFLGDTYSHDPEYNPRSDTAQFIEGAIKDKKVILTGGDLKPIFPIYYKDALAGINQIILGKGSKQKSYFLFYNHPQTYISAVQIMERMMPDIQISYTEETGSIPPKTRDEIEREVVEAYSLNPAYLDKFFEGFEKNLQHFIDRGPIKRDIPKIVEKPVLAFERQKPKLKFSSLTFLWAFLIFVVLNIALGIASVFLFTGAVSAFRKNDFNTMKQNIRAASIFFSATEPAVKALVASTNLLGFRGLEENYLLFSQGMTLLSIASEDFDGIEKMSQTGLPKESLEKKIADAFYLYFTGVKLKSETDSSALNAVLTTDLTDMLSLSQVMPQILGYDREKTYLVLFQNDGELRPTGGFIGSVGEVRVKQGKMEKITIEDVYEYDGKLKVHIEPHIIVRRYLQKNLYLRDSNFELDFQKAAAKAALIYNLETGRKVDGVIALNFEAVRRVIDEVGPVKLSSYNQTLDGKNAFDFLQKTIDDNFFPGSTQKRDVLQALFDQMMLKLEDKNSVIKVARLLPVLAAEKNILFAFNEISAQSVFSSIDLGGELKDKRSTGMRDILSINEANIGVNKANSKVSRDLNYTINMSDNKSQSSITYTLINSFDKEYKTYIRFLTPVGSKISGIKVDGTEQKIIQFITDPKIFEAKNFKTPEGLEVLQTTEENFQIFGFVTSVPAGSKQVIELTYENGVKKPTGEELLYSLKLIKQPGVKNFPITLTIQYGEGYSPIEVKNAKLEGGKVIISSEVEKDKEFKVNLLKR